MAAATGAPVRVAYQLMDQLGPLARSVGWRRWRWTNPRPSTSPILPVQSSSKALNDATRAPSMRNTEVSPHRAGLGAAIADDWETLLAMKLCDAGRAVVGSYADQHHPDGEDNW